jgi:segregation and condensation protein B
MASQDSQWALLYAGSEAVARSCAHWEKRMRSFYQPPARGPLNRPQRGRLPANRRLPAVYRFPLEGGGDAAATGERARDPRLAWVEAALLAADEPLTTRRLAAAAGLADGGEARRLVRQLQGLYDQVGSAFQVEEVAGGFQLLTRPEYHRWLVRLRRTGHDLRLTAAARETLAIIAYRQPIMRADIEAIRGVHCGEILGLLMEKGLVRITGRDETLGRPLLYGATKKFLQVFGLKSLRDLPLAEQLRPPDKKKEEGGEEELTSES